MVRVLAGMAPVASPTERDGKRGGVLESLYLTPSDLESNRSRAPQSLISELDDSLLNEVICV